MSFMKERTASLKSDLSGTATDLPTSILLNVSNLLEKPVVGPLADAIIDGSTTYYFDKETVSLDANPANEKSILYEDFNAGTEETPIATNRYFYIGSALGIANRGKVKLYYDKLCNDILIIPDITLYPSDYSATIEIAAFAYGYILGDNDAHASTILSNNANTLNVLDTEILGNPSINTYAVALPGMGKSSLFGYTETMHYSNVANLGRKNMVPFCFIELDLETIFGSTQNVFASSLVPVTTDSTMFTPMRNVPGQSKILIPFQF